MGGFRSAIKTGGGFLNGDAEFVGYEFVDHSFTEETTGDYCYFVPSFKVDGAEEPVTQSLLIGSNEYYNISKDGQELTMVDGSPVTFSGKIGMGRFLTTLIEASDKSGADIESELPDLSETDKQGNAVNPLTFEALIGKRFRLRQVDDVERNESKGPKKVKDKKTGKMKEYPWTYTAVDAILGVQPTGKQQSASRANGSGKSNGIETRAVEVLKAALPTNRKNLSLPVTKALMKDKQKDPAFASAVRDMVFDEEWQGNQDWLEVDKKGNLSVAA